ncbi:MAG: TRAP transporter small permease [Dongiaceae bacterium]
MKVLDRLEEGLITFLMAAATIIIFLAVVHRYAAGVHWLYPITRTMSFSWAQELCIYMFVWMAKFGAAYGVRTGIHVGVDVLVNRLRPKGRHGCIIFGLLAGAFFTGTIGTLGATLVYKIFHTSQTSADLELPMWLVYLAIPCGSYLMCFRFLQVCWRYVQTHELPSHHGAHVEGVDDLHPRGGE